MPLQTTTTTFRLSLSLSLSVRFHSANLLAACVHSADFRFAASGSKWLLSESLLATFACVTIESRPLSLPVAAEGVAASLNVSASTTKASSRESRPEVSAQVSRARASESVWKHLLGLGGGGGGGSGSLLATRKCLPIVQTAQQ